MFYRFSMRIRCVLDILDRVEDRVVENGILHV
jgi:hypothetical protein